MIARALVHEPKLLLLDEPTAGVDVELRRSTWDFLREINRNGTTIVLTTHYLEEAESLCRKIAIIDKGSIVEFGHMKDLLAKSALGDVYPGPGKSHWRNCLICRSWTYARSTR